MNIKDFEDHFFGPVLARGRAYFRNNITHMERLDDYTFEFTVSGTRNYKVEIMIDENGDVVSYFCNCPYGDLCKHEAAALYYVRKLMRSSSDLSGKSTQRSDSVARILIKDYSRKNQFYANNGVEENSIHISCRVVKEWGDSCLAEFRIGRIDGKSYTVKDLPELVSDFETNNFHIYGKALEFIHSPNVLDDVSKRILRFISNNLKYCYGHSLKKYIHIYSPNVYSFLKIFSGGEIEWNREVFKVSLSLPDFGMKIERSKDNMYLLSMRDELSLMFSAPNLVVMDRSNMVLSISDLEHTDIVGPLAEALSKQKISISNEDMPAFYKSVMEPVSRYVTFLGTELLEDIKPPELSVEIYLDMPSENEITGELKFIYGNEIFDPFKREDEFCDNPFADVKKENMLKDVVKRYFDINYGKTNNLSIVGEDGIYELISAGLSEISKYCEVMLSEEFKKSASCRKLPVSLGVRINGGLLEMNFECEGYSVKELIDMLKEYNRGKKYYRLRGGEFLSLEGGAISELSELTSSLNIKSGDISDEIHIEIPKYRMLYIDALKKHYRELNISESKDFNKEIRRFRALAEMGDYDIPENIEKIMREYQKDGFRWFKTICEYGFGGILADDMGLGKTLQAIALMESLKGNNNKFLVVCPASLVLNWKAEIEKFSCSLECLIVSGTAEERLELIKKFADADVMVTSYNSFVRDIEAYKGLHFCIHFIDEAQYIKNHNTQAAKAVKKIKSDTRFALTGTPIENTLAELWSIFDFIMPSYLYNYTYFRTNFENPIVREKSERKTESLKRLVSPFILRRMKKEVLTELPDKTETTLAFEMGEEQKKLYAANFLDFKTDLLSAGREDDNKNRFKVLAMLTRLRQICCDPHLVYEDYSGESAKLEQCMELVENCIISGHKVLLFSQFTSMLDIIADKFSDSDISYYMLTGETKISDRISLVDRFNRDDTNVFLISLKAGGTGINLTGADIVIHYDPWWNLSAENQASDRAYRIGQRNNVQVYKLICKGTVEEKICELQKAKAALAEIADGGENIMKMSAEDILKLFEK